MSLSRMTMSTSSPAKGNETLGRIVNEMRKSDGTQQVIDRAMNDLTVYITAESQEASAEHFAGLIRSLRERILVLCNSVQDQDKLCSVAMIDTLLDFNFEDNDNLIKTRFPKYLEMIFTHPTQHEASIVVQKAAKLAGKLSLLGGDFAENQIRDALSWLEGDRDEFKRYAATLVLKELIIASPTLFNQHVSSFLDHIWVALCDEKLYVRESALVALRHCLYLLVTRPSRYRLQNYFKVFGEAQRGFSDTSSVNRIHASLLTLGELVECCGEFMLARYREACDTTLSLFQYKNPMIRQTIILLLPKLAIYCPNAFSRKYVESALIFLVSTINTGQFKSIAFTSLGTISRAVGDDVYPHLKIILDLIESEVRHEDAGCNDALMCLGQVAHAVGSKLKPYINYLFLDSLFSLPFSEALIECLGALGSTIDDLLIPIQEYMLSVIVQILSHKVYSPPSVQMMDLRTSSSEHFRHHEGRSPRSPGDMGFAERPKYETSTTLISLALKTMVSFTLPQETLLPLVRDALVPFLDHGNTSIRNEAALSCVHLLPRLNTGHSRFESIVTSDILERLLIVTVADSNLDIRRSVLQQLDARYDTEMLRPQCTHLLFIALKDEITEIKQIAMEIIGRLALLKPSSIMPVLRKTVIELLGVSHFSTDSKQIEESILVLQIIVSRSAKLIHDYVDSIFAVLLPLVQRHDSNASSAALSTIGHLSRIGSDLITAHLDELIAIMVRVLQNNGPEDQYVALTTMKQVVENTGFVVEPYYRFKDLLPTLLQVLKAEPAWKIKEAAMKCLGTLGALDPFIHKMNMRDLKASQGGIGGNFETGDAIGMVSSGNRTKSASLNQTRFVLQSLLRILRDSALSQHHQKAASAIAAITGHLGINAAKFLSLVVPSMVSVIEHCDDQLRSSLFAILSTLVQMTKSDMTTYLTRIFDVVHQCWDIDHNFLLPSIIDLCEHIAHSCNHEFRSYLPRLLPRFLNVLQYDYTQNKEATLKCLEALAVFGSALNDYLELLVPSIMRLSELLDASQTVRQLSIETIGHLTHCVDFGAYSSRIIHPFARLLQSTSPSDVALAPSTLNTLCGFLSQLGPRYIVYIPMIDAAMQKNGLAHKQYTALIRNILKGVDVQNPVRKAEPKPSIIFDQTQNMDMKITPDTLLKAWDVTDISSKDDWVAWLGRFSIELVKASPSYSIRQCQTLATSYPRLARDLLHIAFASCWSKLSDYYLNDLLKHLESIFTSTTIPPEVLQVLLNLVESMERNGTPLPLNTTAIGEKASLAHAYAKALHYKEQDFRSTPYSAIQSLITINNQLQQPEAAFGILQFAQHNLTIELKESWYEELQQWEDALGAYERKQLIEPSSFDLSLGRLRCLRALGEWSKVLTLSRSMWGRTAEELTIRSDMAPIAATAAWKLEKWDELNIYAGAIADTGTEGSFFHAIIALKRDQFGQAQEYIDHARKTLGTELTALLGESYDRAYRLAVKAQQLSELEEVIRYKQSGDHHEQHHIRCIWQERLRGCQKDIDVWQSLLSTRSLVLSPAQDTETWLKFSSLCRKSGRLNLSHNVLASLLGSSMEAEAPHLDVAQPSVAYAYLKYTWASGNRETAYSNLQQLLSQLESIPNSEKRLLAKCHMRLGSWQNELKPDFGDLSNVSSMLQHFKSASNLCSDQYNAQHLWAFMNYKVVAHIEAQHKGSGSRDQIAQFAVPAVHGFFSSIDLGGGMQLQDTLRLLTIWFRYGSHPDIEAALEEGFDRVSIDTWLAVIPQIIARISSSNLTVRRLVHKLLSALGEHHPQSLIYPLTVASKSTLETRKGAAAGILMTMRRNNGPLVEQASLVSHELIRIAVLWHELWHEALEQASTAYFGNRDIQGLIEALAPMHEMLAAGPETPSEIAFLQMYGRDLKQACDWFDRYSTSGMQSDINQAWHIYVRVFRSIDQRLKLISNLELQYASPKLLAMEHLDLAVPSSYAQGSGEALIERFMPSLKVLESKQKPRKLTVLASNGREYPFLLKGHEDLRQDERVMQVFGLVNTLLAHDRQTSTKDLSIRRYSAIPLAPNSGLIEWMSRCDTLHAVVQEYRSYRTIMMDMERKMLMHLSPTRQYDMLTALQKTDVFEQAMSYTSGRDLCDMLWLKSPNSEAWLDRRTNFTRSTAVMSIVGYILGLGDRHPCNLMLDQITGKLIHIDFGDCFEVAMKRDKYPETIPFRLTRMLVNAMEVSGVEGNYRTTTINVMRVLRENQESVMAVLEAFVHDPLINWRLKSKPRKASEAVSQSLPDDGYMDPSSKPHRKLSRSTVEIEGADDGDAEIYNAHALEVIGRIRNKLTGHDFDDKEELSVERQVQRLILQATSVENLSQCYTGWCPFW